MTTRTVKTTDYKYVQITSPTITLRTMLTKRFGIDMKKLSKYQRERLTPHLHTKNYTIESREYDDFTQRWITVHHDTVGRTIFMNKRVVYNAGDMHKEGWSVGTCKEYRATEFSLYIDDRHTDREVSGPHPRRGQYIVVDEYDGVTRRTSRVYTHFHGDDEGWTQN